MGLQWCPGYFYGSWIAIFDTSNCWFLFLCHKPLLMSMPHLTIQNGSRGLLRFSYTLQNTDFIPSDEDLKKSFETLPKV